MKRPLLIAAVIVLSGTVCGLKETPVIIRTAAVCITAAFLLYLISKLRGRIAAAAVIVMTAAYLLGYGRSVLTSMLTIPLPNSMISISTGDGRCVDI